MRHQQIVDKLAASGLVKALDEDLARGIGHQMLGATKSPDALREAVTGPILERWRPRLDSAKVRLALAALLHKYGMASPDITDQALTAIDELERGVVLSDAFSRQVPAIRELLLSPPVPLTRRPRQPKPTTFHRPGDVISFELRSRFHAAFVREVHGANEYPIVEFYQGVFDRVPVPSELVGRPSARDRGRARFAVIGMTYVPDPAGQVVVIASGQPDGPVGEEPRPGEGLYTLSDILGVQRAILGFHEGQSLHAGGRSGADPDLPGRP
ncbi:hypothetical protein FB565_008133 [Actinoplanes lutulentus]|uniref:hypothetical protein n=1 Tax=Actinoplanes lutulentus TaxID=1287878 RepID=UPI0011B934AC|nr:hypothetical protein [Actinoplanes lutulentus]MBB2948350.1 hypothetical protein [Actinoplanes lutulentus]